ncbi:hypothetical protein TREMEDRAFT_62662 [Tremella mesenterica DSM 1558]|uniref:uncharacterized protein n=1 Tax=Tremella mesenterica (strain ATCC 24925 / CBS 8224 / DSM 1558 / NBRC 9311 / NRRL Y-6157 / RJB 2259-6 / UBC 559-6) TaxID=578456 RepID=UPI0003F49758|nr:uncharacterized protein TREMEDRAFT_62662 [Tremella mesenterica DSM 1558]EIW68949.1 hypothetical protein TREMEDRAFT_62662 [Tremella mesenterica DSM 1558]
MTNSPPARISSPTLFPPTITNFKGKDITFYPTPPPSPNLDQIDLSQVVVEKGKKTVSSGEVEITIETIDSGIFKKDWTSSSIPVNNTSTTTVPIQFKPDEHNDFVNSSISSEGNNSIGINGPDESVRLDGKNNVIVNLPITDHTSSATGPDPLGGDNYDTSSLRSRDEIGKQTFYSASLGQDSGIPNLKIIPKENLSASKHTDTKPESVNSKVDVEDHTNPSDHSNDVSTIDHWSMSNPGLSNFSSPASVPTSTLVTPQTPSQGAFDDFFTGLSYISSTDLTEEESTSKSIPIFSIESETTPTSTLNTSVSRQHRLGTSQSITNLRLTAPTSLLGVLGGNRVLSFNPHSLLALMPTTAAAIALPRDTDEDQVEDLLGGRESVPTVIPLLGRSSSKGKLKINGWSESSIFVHPPTPERIQSPATESEDKMLPTSDKSTGSSRLFARSSPLPHQQVLPEVRSPPRSALSMATDSIQLSQRRGRRPRLFGFTELPETSGSSGNSSRANSRNNSRDNSPETSSSTLVQPSPKPQTTATSSPIKVVKPSPVSNSVISSSAPVYSSNPTSPPQRGRRGYVSPPSTSNPLPASKSEFMVRGPSQGALPRRPTVRVRSEAALKTLQQQPQLPRRRENGLKLDFTGIIKIPPPEDLESAVISSPFSAKLIRKKSGEILKPAIKYSGPLTINGTPLPEDEPRERERPRFESKSCPNTPSCPKYVHFDSHLERVKVFRGDQKPQVVSRNGSPTEHPTSGEESEFPFPSTDEDERDKRVLQIRLPNFPSTPAPDADFYLESLFLDDDRKSLKGVVMCRNFSFQKWVAVRFTFDFWQTTSEVTASHKDSVRGGTYDRFCFVIKLHDLLAKIEEKSLYIALRYTTDGRELWDSNGGQNYQVVFEKNLPVKSKKLTPARGSGSIQPGMGKAVGGRTSQWTVAGGQDDRMADLRAKLERMSADDPDSPPQSSTGAVSRIFSPTKRLNPLSPEMNKIGMGSPRFNFSSLEPNQPGSPSNPMGELPTTGQTLAARYDFNSAFKFQTRRNSNSPSPRPDQLPDVRTGLITFGKSPNKRTSSPPILSESESKGRIPDGLPNISSGDTFFSPRNMSSPLFDTDEFISPKQMTIKQLENQDDLGIIQRSKEEKVQDESNHVEENVLDEEDDETDEMNDSPPALEPSGSVTDTPSESPKSPAEPIMSRWSPTARIRFDKGEAGLDKTYTDLVEQYCWGGSAITMEPRRSHSASDLESYFSNPPSPTKPPNNHIGDGTTTPKGKRPGLYHSHSCSHDGISSTSQSPSWISTRSNGKVPDAKALEGLLSSMTDLRDRRGKATVRSLGSEGMLDDGVKEPDMGVLMSMNRRSVQAA